MAKDRPWLKTLIALSFLLITIPLFLPGLFSSRKLVYQGDRTSSDVTEANFPRRDLLGRSLKTGRFPLWTNLVGCGFPLLGEGQTGVLYPFNLLFFRLLDSVLAYNLNVILSFIISLLFCYFLARDMGLSRFASVFASVSFSFSAFMVTRIKFMNMINALAWMPACAWSIGRFAKGIEIKYLLLTSIFLSLQILAGNPQIFYITLLLTITFFLYLVFPQWRSSWRVSVKESLFMIGKALSLLAISLALVIALSMPQLLAQWEGRGVSTRSGGITQEEANIYPYNPLHLILFVSPYQLGNPAQHTYNDQRTIFWENISYPGLLTLVLALIALGKTFSSNRHTRYFLFSLTVALLISLGANTPLYGFLWRYLPGMNLFRFPQRFLAVATISLSLLGGIGLDYLTGIKSDSGGMRRNFASMLAFLSLLVLVIDLFCFASNQINTIDQPSLLEGRTIANILDGLEGEPSPGNFRIASLGAAETWTECYLKSSGWLGNLASFQNYWNLLPADYNMLHDVENIEAQGNYGIERIKFLNDWTMKFTMLEGDRIKVPDSSVRIWAVENVAYILSTYQVENSYLQRVYVEQVGFSQEERSNLPENLYIYRNTMRLPRAYMTSDYRIIRLEDEHIYTLFGRDFVPSKTVYLEEEPVMDSGCDSADGCESQVEIINYAEDHVELIAESSKGGLLVLSDTYYPGWKGMVDGKEKPILRANLAFRAIALSPGRHHVIFTYSPASFEITATLACFFWLACAATTLILFLRGKSRISN